MLATFVRALKGVADPTVVYAMRPRQIATLLEYDVDPEGSVRRGPGLCEHGRVAPECPDCRSIRAEAMAALDVEVEGGVEVDDEEPRPVSVLRKVI